MAANNQVHLTGNLGADSEEVTVNDKTFISLRLATTDSYKDRDSGEWKDRDAVWHDVTVWRSDLQAFAKRLKKGERIKVTGSLSYQTKEKNGVKYRDTRITAHKLEDAPLTKKASESEAVTDTQPSEEIVM